MAAYLVTIFLGSFLLFQVEPLIGRYILPWFGGSPAVWTTCMLFFQVMLLAGYGYAHLMTSFNRRGQGFIHAALLAGALAFLPIAPSAELWKPLPADEPVSKILLLLLANIGVPYLVLAATAPLLQHWFVRSYPQRSPYRLYALSNAASFLALVSYPFLVEPNLTLARQVSVWGWGFAGFALCCAWCALRAREAAPALNLADDDPADTATIGLSMGSLPLWLALSACGSAALLAVTNQLCQEVAVVPFLWVAPLAIYLATFTACFNSDRSKVRGWWIGLFAASLVPAFLVLHAGAKASLPMQVCVYLIALLACCMACHGELAAARPPARQLTAYYLTIATGGALGGVFVAVIAPLSFSGFWEFPISMALSAFTVAAALRRNGTLSKCPRWVTAATCLALVALVVASARYITAGDGMTVAKSRNFYGVLRVSWAGDQLGPFLYLQNGRVLHGSQYYAPELRSLPCTYYGEQSGAGLALSYHPNRLASNPSERAIRVGVIGLGAGTLATYGRPGDTFRFYEINSEVTRFADRYFTYRSKSAARIETVPGDARIMLENEQKCQAPQRFDVLIVDAFSSDSIPVHLLTRECFAIYRYHLNPGGLLLVHVTNHFLDLVPIVAAQAERLGLEAVLVNAPHDQAKGASPSKWMILSENHKFLNRLKEVSKFVAPAASERSSALWTDDYVSVWKILKW